MSNQPIPASVYEWAEIFCDEHRHIEDDRELVARAYLLATQAPASQLGLTAIQASGLEFITDYVKTRGMSPSFDDVAEGLGMKSRRAVHRLVHQLVDRGVINMAPRRARSITIVGRA